MFGMFRKKSPEPLPAHPLTVPGNIPADVIKNIQRFIDAVSEADDAAGINNYGLYVVDDKNNFQLFGVGNEEIARNVVQAVAGGMLITRLFSPGACTCPECNPDGQNTKSTGGGDTTDALISRVFRGRKDGH